MSSFTVCKLFIVSTMIIPLNLYAAPELPRTLLDTDYVTPSGENIDVQDGGDLQAAIDQAIPGDRIRLVFRKISFSHCRNDVLLTFKEVTYGEKPSVLLYLLNEVLVYFLLPSCFACTT